MKTKRLEKLTYKCFVFFVIGCLGYYVHAISVYKSCMDVLNDLGENETDGEYTIFLENKVGMSIYCHDFRSGQPREYLTLKAKRSSNIAAYYAHVGSKDACTDLSPVRVYSEWGDTEFSKLRLNTRSLVVDTTDFTFTKNLGPNKIRYGRAGDQFSSSPTCEPMGAFLIDLRGTPLSLSPETKWAWTGNYSRGNVLEGQAIVKNKTYLGCWQNGHGAFQGPSFSYPTDMTQYLCVKKCRELYGSKYAGLEAGIQCYCTESYDSIGAAEEDDCNKPCSGDPNQICGGSSSVSVYSTDVGQVFYGRCGGYPGYCFPTTTANPKEEKLQLRIAYDHRCLSLPCQNEGRCVADSYTKYHCICYNGYGGADCKLRDEIILDGPVFGGWLHADCPAGYRPETCKCQEANCTGANFHAGNKCFVDGGNPRVICRPEDPGRTMIVDFNGQMPLTCPLDSVPVGCSYYGIGHTAPGTTYGQGIIVGRQCNEHDGCNKYSFDRYGQHGCLGQVRCKVTICNCGAHGHCNLVTGGCECDRGYYGDECEIFDYCAYYEDLHNASACTDGSICRAVYKKTVKAYGGDKVGDTCIFPFDYKGVTYNSCVDDNTVGPPFTCGGVFRQSSGYIDLGQWSPGNKYTIAAWVRPAGVDTIRRTVVGGVQDCNDFGFNLNSGTFRGFLKLSKECTRDLDAGKPFISIGQWYMIAVTNNATHMVIYQNGEYRDSNTVLMNHYPTTAGFRIGGEVCCPTDYFNGWIRTVKVWKRALSREDINRSMYNLGTSNSTVEALHDGLIGHWELADSSLPTCTGIDHKGAAWVIRDGQFLTGIHCNISRFYVPKGVKAYIQPYDGSKWSGMLDVTAKTVLIDGIILGNGAGYRGGSTNSKPGDGGTQGESYLGPGKTSNANNGGGGGGGEGAAWAPDGLGHGGGGGTYVSDGMRRAECRTEEGRLSTGSNSMGYPGSVYGDISMSTLYRGSGGGSGGNALDLSTNPKGGRGGNGGGAIKLTAQVSITVNGGIEMNGDHGEGDAGFIPLSSSNSPGCPLACNISGCLGNSTRACWDYSGPGGGGSGGSIYLVAKYVNIGTNKISVRFGFGGAGTTTSPGVPYLTNCGGNGGNGRIRIDSVVFKGQTAPSDGIVRRKNMTNLYFDHSQGGQKLIDPLRTEFGNEVYWGCFEWIAFHQRNPLEYALPLTTHVRRLMTPDYCIYRCREKGYKYSGTQNGQECYCDNHLTLDNKVHDSVCNMSCDGDPLQMCGGNNKLQIFGPPPSSPAVGQNVVPKCEPWCVTADQLTDNPKWGLCSPHTPVITDWKIQCDCPPGKTGYTCDQLCPRWTYGTACKYNCTCYKANTAYCEPSTGECKCRPGFEGPVCNSTCNEGFFGQDCKSPCNCSNNALCDPQSGKCRCRPGWTGADCQFPCPKNKFGVDCNQTCSCFHGSCSPEHGQCQCDPGYKLPTCFERCDPLNYGQDCLLQCDCNGQFCDSVTGLCRCGPGYIGNKCSIMCSHGTWGQGCHKKCPCQNGFGCDHVTGQCLCGPGFIGETCDMQCSYGRFGSDCLGVCSCVMNQTSTCNAINGACFCLPGYHGYNCEKPCNQGFFGEGCKQMCSCLHDSSCNLQRGTCKCPRGFIGNKCELPCPDGSYGIMCQDVCPACSSGICSKVNGSCICKPGAACTCPEGYWGPSCANACTCVHGICDSSAGTCQCSDGWQGTNCDQPCSSGKYGSGCNSDCKCINGTCDPVTGSCACDAGFTTDACNRPCKPGSYGPNCRFPCQRCAAHAYPGCDATSGNCLCSDGYTGPLCDRPCPVGTHGKNCSFTCSCDNGGFCDSVTGKCSCPAGFRGQRCDQTVSTLAVNRPNSFTIGQWTCRHCKQCPAGSWGVNCSQACNCGPHGIGCTAVEGLCICKPGFTGVKCRESCPVSTYGNNCSMPCHCDPFHGRCSPIDGSCFCDAGWTGTFCDMVCNTGWWGRGCTQKCQCNGRGTCDPFTGVCDCDVGYLGSACDQQCKQDVFWGDNCANKCDCGGEHCDFQTGKCTCPAGRTGHQCEHVCDSNHFGFLCAQLCGCRNNAKCDSVTGFCTCQPGWSGQFCTDSCPEGYYGVDCSQSCPECQNGGSCDTFTGLCNCPEGFTDPICNTSSSQVDARLAASQTPTATEGVTLSVGQLVGLILGLVIIAMLAVIVAVIFTRKKYVGRFGDQSGAMKFPEEVEIKETQQRSDVAATTTGFINPVNVTSDLDESIHDSKSEISETTSGIASNAVDSDDDDKNCYFKDSSA